MKKTVAFILAVTLSFLLIIPCFASDGMEEEDTVLTDLPTFTVDAPCAILMEASTGSILFEQNASEARSPASVTKIMTLLLVMEALEEGKYSLTDTTQISAYAASMGGSQVFLEEGETMTVEDLIKCTVISSANDAAVALAELTAGSEGAFVERMNERAKELGMESSHFENVTGLDDTTENHVTSAKDIALMTRALCAYPKIFEYSSLWQDTIRDGAFTLTNTNRLVRFYQGCNGLKTGSTDKAGFCISVTAKRGDMQLIAVIMGAADREARNRAAKELLDYGFAEYELFRYAGGPLESVPVLSGDKTSVPLAADTFYAVVKRGSKGKIDCLYDIPKELYAPVKSGESVGTVTFRLGEETVGQTAIRPTEDVSAIGITEIFGLLVKNLIFGAEKS